MFKKLDGATKIGICIALSLLASIAAGQVYNQFSPGGALSGTWNSQNVNVGAGSPFITGTLPVGNGGTGQTSISGLLLGAGSSIGPYSGSSCTGQFVTSLNGSGVVSCGSGAAGANPTGLIGLTAVNGSATTFTRSDSTHALDQSIVPTWTGAHTFSATANPLTVSSSAIASGVFNSSATSGGYIEIEKSASAIGYFGSGASIIGASASGDLAIAGPSISVAIGDSGGSGAIDALANNSTHLFQVVDSAGNLFNAGYLGTPYVTVPSTRTLALSDRGKMVECPASGTITVPGSTFSTGDVISITMDETGTCTVNTSGGATLYWANGTTSSTGSRILTGYSVQTIFFDSGSTAYITGSGIS